jgi:hypothetical protein
MDARIASLVLGAAAALSACATTNNPPPKSASNAPACLGTGSRLANGACTAAPSRSYSKEDLDRTGQTTAAGALGMVDPSITISH